MKFHFIFVLLLLNLHASFSNPAVAQPDLDGVQPTQPAELKVLFLGDQGAHQPRLRFAITEPVLADRGIKLTYTEKITDLNPDHLAQFDALLLYANIDNIQAEQEQALLDYVAEGGGFVPIHCATYCFRNSKRVVALMGAQFQRHGTGTFRTFIDADRHPVMQGFGGFESWDETYVHHLHNEKNRTVLAYRVDDEGREPWTWIRTHGQGRVFYTAWGHDQRTWGNRGFQNLLERGIRWAAQDDPAKVPDFFEDAPFPIPKLKAKRTDIKPFEYMEAAGDIPNYTPSDQWGVQGQPFTKMQKPLAPEESLKHIIVPEKFSVQLFASEPEIGGKPIAMTWDERGRLWIAETYDYPNELQPVGKGRDRIRILEDTDGDWRADRFTVFADQLSIPTTMTFHDGGVIVQDGKRTLYLKDTDGDDVADQRQVMFEGWAQNDTHGGVSNFQYGLDNWIWAMQGYNSSTPTIDDVKQQAFKMGFFRFKPDGSQIEFLRSTNNNTWGLGISEEGIVFGSTANRAPSVYLPIPNRYYERVRGWKKNLQLDSIADTHLFQPVTDKIRQVDHHGGYTAAAGHALYTAREYPKEYWNRTAFVNGPTGHLVGTFVLKRQGSDFSSSSPFNLFASDDEWTAPIMTEIGPDGNAWVIDWYNYIVQHNPTPKGFKQGKGNAYETPLRDKKFGRVYRVIYNNQSAPPYSLADASPEKLVATLSHPTMLWRKHAQRLLVERGKPDILPDLIKLIEDPSVDEIGLNVGAIHAIGTVRGLISGETEQPLEQWKAISAIVAALQHPSAGVRRNAVQALPLELKTGSRKITPSTQTLLDSGVIEDDDPQVRLVAMLALADMIPTPSAAQAIVRASTSRSYTDRWLQDALISAAANQGHYFLVEAAKTKRPGSQLLEATRIVAEHTARHVAHNDQAVNALFDSSDSSNPEIMGQILDGFAAGWPDHDPPVLSPKVEANLEQVMESLTDTQRGALIQLARKFGSERFEAYARQVQNSFLQQLDDPTAEMELRISAAQQSIEFMDSADEAVHDILVRITPQTDPELAIGMVDSLRRSRSPVVGTELIQSIDSFSPKLRQVAIGVLLSKLDSTTSLLQGLEDGKILLSELTTDQIQSFFDHPNVAIRERARRLMREGGALPDPDRQNVLESLMIVTKQKGNAASGKETFTKQCSNCHMHNGQGQKIGPDLTGMAVHPKAELLTHIVDPSRDVEGNYRMYKLMTVDGQLINGLLGAESQTSVEIFDTAGKKHVVLREDIEQIVASRKSAMPEGFEKQISSEQMRDLLEFLTARGKYVPLDISDAATLASDRGMFVSTDNDVERLIFENWQTKTFQGVPFSLTDPQDGTVKNAIVLNGPLGNITKKLPTTVRVRCGGSAKSIHLLSGVSGWGFPFDSQKTVSMIVRLHFEDGTTEDHELRNGDHFADYIRRVDVPQSEFAFALRGQQIRYLAIRPKRRDKITEIEFVKGPDKTAPVVMAVTVESANWNDEKK